MTIEEQMAAFDKKRPLPIIVEGTDAYFRDQQELLAHRTAHPADRWVTYHGSRRIAVGTTQREVFIQALNQGIPRNEILVLAIDPSVQRVMETTL